ncbi:hypothetical protein [Lactococcus lactis]
MEAQNNSGSDPESYRKKDSLKVDKHFYHFNLIYFSELELYNQNLL